MMKYLEDFILHAESSTDKEICGLVVNFRGKPIYYKCNNIATNKSDEFILDPIDYAKASTMGDIIYVCHSHVNVAETASSVDVASCNNGTADWIIYSTVTKKHSIIEPSKNKQSLLGRPYVYNVNDCWSLIRDVYREELNIGLPRTIADSDFNWYLDTNKNYFESYAEEVGFTRVKDKSIKKYDVILFKTYNAQVPNHCAVYYADNIILHHQYNRLSVKEVFGGYWLKSTQSVYRYRG